MPSSTHPRSRGRAPAALAGLAALALLTAACSSIDTSTNDAAAPSSAAGAPVKGGTLHAFVSGDPGTMDPALITGYNQNLVAANVLEGLFRLSPDSTEIQPGLAESAELSGSTWTIKLRDAKFSDGSPVTANDVKFSFERLVNPKTASPRAALLDSVAGAAQAKTGAGLSGIKVVDDKTLTIELAQPDASFKAKLASPNLAVVSQKATEAAGDQFGRKVVSAGPFSLDTWTTNSTLTAKASDTYWNGRPYLDSVEWKVIGDESTRMVDFEAGTLDIAWLPPSYYAKYANDPAWKPYVQRTDSVHTEMFAVNMARSPLGTSLAARQAICYGVDRDAVIASLQGRATKAVSLLPPGLGAADASSGGCNYDPEKAKTLAQQAGLTGKTLVLMSHTWSNLVATLTLYQSNLKKAGITVKLEPVDDAVYSQRLAKGDFDLAWDYRVPDYLDRDSFLSPLLSSARIGTGNSARYSNAQIDGELGTALKDTQDSQRNTTYSTVDTTVAQQLPYIPLVHNVYVDIHAKKVQGYKYSALDLPDYSKVWITQ
jgi:ABC-type transport system substrate-binding protein